MALGDPYVTLDQLKAYLRLTDSVDDVELASALASASAEIEKYCGRQFNKATSASARVYQCTGSTLARVDDFHTTTGLVIATGPGDATYATTWATSDYQLEPLNGIVDGETGWPYSRINARTQAFPVAATATLQVTAQWGWNAVPAMVKQACLVLASETFKLKDAPFGVAGIGEYGPIRVKNSPIACRLLAPYRRDPVLVA